MHDRLRVAISKDLVIEGAWSNEREVADKSSETRLENPRVVHVRVKNVAR